MPTRKAKEGESVVHLFLDRDLWARVRKRGVDESVPAVEIVRRALADYLRKPKGGSR